MLRDGNVFRRIIAPFMFVCILFLAAAPTVLATSDVQKDAALGAPQHYLALGDSLAYGFQPNGDHTHGYVDDFITFLQSQGVKDNLNAGCLGETSSTFINGGECPYHPYFHHSLLLRVAIYNIKHSAGQVTLVTLDIGANDLLGDINSTTCKVSNTFTADLQTLDTNLTQTILPQLHAALKDNQGRILGNLMLLNYYDVFQNKCPNTVENVQMINDHLAHDVEAFGTLVNIFEAFGGAAVPNPNICTDTWACSPAPGPDIHPTTAGYQVIANAIEEALQPHGKENAICTYKYFATGVANTTTLSNFQVPEGCILVLDSLSGKLKNTSWDNGAVLAFPPGTYGGEISSGEYEIQPVNNAKNGFCARVAQLTTNHDTFSHAGPLPEWDSQNKSY